MKFLTNKFLLLLIFFSSLISCQNNKELTMNWKIIDFNKISGETPFNTYFDALNRYKFNQIVTYNKDIFFLLGDDSGENSDSPSAVVYRSIDFGNTLHKTILGKGSIKEGVFAEKNLFVVFLKV